MKSQYALPFTIVIAGGLIAGGVFLAGKAGAPTTGSNTDGKVTNVRDYTPGTDHILGNPNAQVKVIEYLDLECPYCKTFNTTMHQIMDYYGDSGKVAWVQRPFPLAQLHSKAPQEAHAAECVAEQGGDSAYFAYTDKIFEITPSNNGLDLSQLPVIAKDLGLNVDSFNACMESGKYSEKIQASYNEAISLGAQGTPYTILKVGEDSVVLSGAQPYDSMRAAIDAVLGDLGAPLSPTGTTTQQ
jgi:protein-disulfide isomerase